MIKKLKLSEIVTDAGTQVRAGLNEATVADYAESLADGAKFPPVIVFHDGSRYIAADGFHRIHAASRSGATLIECDIRKGSKSDALKFALGCNAHHGLRRTNADKRHAVGMALREFPMLSDRALAEICIVSDRFGGDRHPEPAKPANHTLCPRRRWCAAPRMGRMRPRGRKGRMFRRARCPAPRRAGCPSPPGRRRRRRFWMGRVGRFRRN